MIFQKVLKGIADISTNDATNIIMGNGIVSNWWRKKNTITNIEIQEELTENNLILHLNHYNQPLPLNHKWAHLGKTYGEVSAFISTSSGAIQRDQSAKNNIIFTSFLTSLKFATRGFKTSGYIFYAYVMVLGKKSIPLQGFSEEVRELHIYKDYLPYHQQGEVTAKISIPSVNIEKAEQYDGLSAYKDIKRGSNPIPLNIIQNPNYISPDAYCNIREVF